MSTLEEYAKKAVKREKTVVMNARVPVKIQTKWLDHIESLGLTSSEAIRILMVKELEAAGLMRKK